jgi:hypothetical protein
MQACGKAECRDRDLKECALDARILAERIASPARVVSACPTVLSRPAVDGRLTRNTGRVVPIRLAKGYAVLFGQFLQPHDVHVGDRVKRSARDDNHTISAAMAHRKPGFERR